jgi:2'-5' RNA ligase
LYTLRLLARVPEDKRQEFLESLRSLSKRVKIGFRRKLLFEDVNDETHFCWMGDSDSKEDLEAFMQSDTFRALRGAAQVLGTLEELRIVEDRTEISGETIE